MGSGASCTASPSTSLDERLRTMLILRAYNCRPRDWTMRDQFDSFAENGILTKKRLREALRLSECPRIEALLDRVLRDHPTAGDKPSTVNSISVTALISFVEAGASNKKDSRVSVPAVGGHSSSQSLPPPQSAMPACKSSENMQGACSLVTTGTPPQSSAPPTKPFDASVDGDDVELLPRVVPLISKWALVPPTAADRKGNGSASATPSGRVEHQGGGDNSSGAFSEMREESIEVLEIVGSSPQGVTGDIGDQSGGKDAFGHCKTLVRHLGSMLRLRGRDAHRRSGPAQPVWRKRETLIQERIVQYTTLDEEGMVQELLETEKSQTDSLHMECKRTGEFAHRESTQYESGEAFNGEVVVEESGVEHYVHLRSTDDEYEHLESTLPPRARQGAAAGADAAGNRAPDACEGGASVDAGGGEAEREEARQGAEASGSSSDDPGAAAEQGHCSNESAIDGTQNNGPNIRRDQYEERQELTGVGEHSHSSSGESSPAQQPSSPQIGCSRHGREESASSTRRNGDATEVTGVGASVPRRPSPSPPSPSYHCRSPSCSPRISPHPARSPYRQEGVGGRESSGRGERRRWNVQEEQHQEGVSSTSTGPRAIANTETGGGRSVGGTHCSAGEKNGKENEPVSFAEEQGDEREAARLWGTGLFSMAVPPVSMPVPLPYLEESDGIAGAQNERGVNGGFKADLRCSTNKPADPTSGFRPSWDNAPPRIAMSVLDDSGDANGDGLFDFGEDRCGSVVFFDLDSGKGGDGDCTGAGGGDWGQQESGGAINGLPIFCEGDAGSVLNFSGEKVDLPRSAAERSTNEASPMPPTSRGFTPSTTGNTDNAEDVPIKGSNSSRSESNGVDFSAPLAASALGSDGTKGRCLVGDSDIHDAGASNEGGREVVHGTEKAATTLPGHAPFHSYVWDRITPPSHDAVDDAGECSFAGGGWLMARINSLGMAWSLDSVLWCTFEPNGVI